MYSICHKVRLGGVTARKQKRAKGVVSPPRAVSFGEVAKLLGRASTFGYQSAGLHVRTVALRWNGGWYNFATTAVLESRARLVNMQLPMRDDVMLIERCVPVRAKLTSRKLTQHLKHWRHIVGATPELDFQDHVDLRREPSNLLKKSWPAWRTQLHEVVNERKTPSNPEGPFLDIDAGIFGQDVPALARHFLGDGNWGAQQSATHEYSLTIPDYRVRISALAIEDNELRVEVENNAKYELHVSIVGTSSLEDRFYKVKRLVRNAARELLPFLPKTLEVWITLRNGYPLDYYTENEYFSTWGKGLSLFKAARAGDLLPIHVALSTGESDTIEYKPYIRLNEKEGKALEILQTVSAFANHRGGDLYFGVTDLGEVEALKANLARDYGKAARGSVDRQKTAYERDLKRYINSRTTPNLPLTFHWHEHADDLILQLSIPKSTEPVHFTRNGDLYRRSNATNMKWRPVDAVLSMLPRAPGL
jgi:hypothetical protein